MTRRILVALIVAAGGTAHADDPPALTPLSDADRAVFLGSPEDELDKPKCEKLEGKLRARRECRDQQSYVHTNEWFLDEFRPYMTAAGTGGAYVGIGSDQGLTLVAWARSEIAWFLDYDVAVVAMNKIVRAAVLESADPEAFVAFWKKGRTAKLAAREVLRREYAADPDLELIVEVHDEYRDKMRRYFVKMLKYAERKRDFHFLHEPADYAYVRAMYQAGRIRILAGDLLKDKAIPGIAAAAKQLGQTVRVLYLSNAEQYWAYTQVFRDNMRALPLDDRSVVLRLLWNQRWGPEKLGPFFYIVQAGLDFQTKLAAPERKRVSRMMKERTPGRTGVFAIGMAPILDP
jgi:hypothetical protein